MSGFELSAFRKTLDIIIISKIKPTICKPQQFGNEHCIAYSNGAFNSLPDYKQWT